MNDNVKHPKTLKAAIEYFANPDNALAYMVRLRWPDGVIACPKCGRTDPVFLKNQRKWQCKSVHHHRQFSAKVGTIFEDSPIPLDKWLTTVWMLSNCKNGVSSYEIARTIGVTQKSAWFMLHRIRLGLRKHDFGMKTKLGGEGGPVEVDETFVGGKMKNMHKGRRVAINQLRTELADKDTEAYPKTAVMGLLDRESRKVRATVVPNVKRETLQAEILKNVKYGSAVFSDSAVAYDKLRHNYVHEVVNKIEGYCAAMFTPMALRISGRC
jgi:transposase-like protein